MKNKFGKKLMSMFFSLCLMISFVTIPAFAEGINYMPKVNVAYTNIDYKAGDIPQATASVTEGDCVVAYECWRELYQKEEGGVWSGTGRYWYSDQEKMTSLPENERITKFEAGHHYSYNIVLAANDDYFFGDNETVVSVGEYEWGTPGNHTNLEIKGTSKKLHIYSIYSVDLPDESQPGTIISATVENAKFDYQPGDTPQATAWVPEANTDKYEIEYECWQKFENNNPVAAWYSDNDSHGSLPTITKFESGKSYVYSIMLKPKDGYSFSSETVITVNGQKVSAPFVGGSMYIPSIKTITMPTVTAVSDYKVIEGANSSWIQNADKTLTFRVDGDLSKFVGIKVDDEWVDKENYTVASGSTIVTLKNEYLKTLSEGEHKITFVYTDGEVSTNFEVNETEKIYENSDNPKTGDNSNILIWISLFVANALAMLGIIVYNKKKKSVV